MSLMASLSDQIDRFTRNTRAIKAAASQAANAKTTSSVFTRAVLYTHLGDLIRDIDPSELGLFTLVDASSTNPYDKDAHLSTDPKITRTQFQGATPLKRRPTRQDTTQEVEAEVYAHAALKYVDQYEPIRPMPRAYDRIVNILNRLNDVRQNIEGLSQTLKQVAIAEEPPLIKIRLESEERNIKELQERIAELSKKKQKPTKIQKPDPSRPKAHIPKEDPVQSPSSPKEEQFFSNAGQTGRTLRFTDNLLHENMNLGDVGEASFDSPSRGPSHLGKSKAFAEADSFIEEPTITQFLPSQPVQDEQDIVIPQEEELSSHDKSSILSELPPPLHTPSKAAETVSPSNNLDGAVPETSSNRHRRIKVNREVEKIVAKIWSTMFDTLNHPKGLSSPSVGESISYIQNLANQVPQLESPITSSASSASIETTSAPTIQQVLTAYLLTMLLSATPHYALPLNQVKENLALKAKTSGISLAGQGTTRVLYGCVAKRLVKIDRGGREQTVRFDV